MPQLSEKPRLGFATKKTTWNPGPNVCNFTVTLGLRATVVENGVGETYSARYYNPLTGRFMSRDPEDHPLTDIKELHRYLYAGGNPVNAVDPTGKGWEDLMAQLDAALDVAADRLTGKAVAKVLACVAATILGKVVGGEGIAGDAGGGLLGGLCAVILGGGGGG
jgi:RHS repeat-associated protein